MDSRKRKASTSKSENSEKKMEKMKKVFEQIREQINDLNRELLTIADIDSFSALKSDLDAGEVLLSWRLKRPDLISDHVAQNEDDSWAHAFARGLSAAMKQRGITEDLPTAALLVRQIERKYLTKTNALIKTRYAAPSLLQNYGCELVVHRRPSLKLLKENEEFEKFIERRVAIGQVAMCFSYVPGYYLFDPKNQKKKAVFRPSVIDIEAMHNEILDDHCAVISGRGVVFTGGKVIEFWEIQETRGPHFADGGFTRMERHMGLITEVYEFRFN